MSNHTKLWNKKKAELIKREQELKNDLEAVSNIFEGRTKTIIIITLATGGVALLAYVVYRSFFYKEEEKTATQKISAAKKTVKKKAILGTILTEKLVSAGIKFAGEQINQLLQSDANKKK